MRTRSVKFAALLAAVVVVQVGLGGPAWAAKGKTLRESYIGGTSVIAWANSCGSFDPVLAAEKNFGKVCFHPLTSMGRYKVSILDATRQPVGFTYTWRDHSGNPYSPPGDFGTGCATRTLTKPRWAVALEIYLDGPNGPVECFVDGARSGSGIATTGEVTLTTPAR